MVKQILQLGFWHIFDACKLCFGEQQAPDFLPDFCTRLQVVCTKNVHEARVCSAPAQLSGALPF
jgi:hypothetical protein